MHLETLRRRCGSRTMDPHSYKGLFHSQKAKNIIKSSIPIVFFWQSLMVFRCLLNLILFFYFATEHMSNWLKSSEWPIEIRDSVCCAFNGFHLCLNGINFLQSLVSVHPVFHFSTHFYKTIRQRHAIFINIYCWPDSERKLPKSTCRLCQSWKC